MHENEKRDLVGLISKIGPEDYDEMLDVMVRQAHIDLRERALAVSASKYVAVSSLAATVFIGRVSGRITKGLGQAPTVAATNPSDGDADVSRTATPCIYFDMEMDPATMIPVNFSLLTGAGGASGIAISAVAIEGSVDLSWTVKLTLGATMAALTTYKLYAGVGAKSLDGVALDGAYTSATAFTTAA